VSELVAAYTAVCRTELRRPDGDAEAVPATAGRRYRFPVPRDGDGRWLVLAGFDLEVRPDARWRLTRRGTRTDADTDADTDAAMELAVDRLRDRLDEGMRTRPPGPRERARLLSTAWRGGGEPTVYADVDALFRAQADRTPDAVAVISGTDRVTYTELAAWTDAVSRRITGLGLGRDDVVAVDVDRGTAAVVAVLAVLRAGAAYLPIGARLPADRARAYLTVAEARAIVADASGARRSAGYRLPLLDIAADRGEADAERAGPAAAPDPESLGYVLFTSGSTGAPKAVAMPRRSLNHHVDWYLHHSESVVHGRTLHFSDLGWDTSTAEIFPTLCAGGSVVVASDHEKRDPDALLRLLCHAEVVRMILPPQVLGHLAEHSLRRGLLPGSLLDVVSGGEQLVLTPVLRRWLTSLPGVTLQNHYGPTETQLVTAYVGDPADAPDLPPIGRPCGNAGAYVLAEDLTPVPIGEVGELYLGGAGLAHGYLGDPASTARRFVANPFDGGATRLYRTGDLVCWRPDGNLQFAGRADRQVKIRGYRVEPAEVESEIARLPGVHSVAVLVTGPETRRALAAFVVAPDATEASLRTRLAERLPDYLVPRLIAIVDALPLSINGKVDTVTLLNRYPRQGAVVGHRSASAGVDGAGPLTVVADAFAQVLTDGPVDADTDLYDAGGDSLAAIAIADRCRRRGLSLGPVDVQSLRTPRRLAAFAATGPVPGPRRPVDTGADHRAWYPLSPSQADGWRLTTDCREHWYQAQLFATVPDVDADVLAGALRQVVAGHASLRLAIAPGPDGAPRQRVLPHAGPELRVVPAPDLPPALAAALDAGRAAMSLAEGRLVHATYLRPPSGRPGHLLVLVHQMAFDMVSWSVLTADLQDAYRDLVESAAPPTFGEPMSFPAWVRALAGYAGSRSGRSELEVWREHGATVSPLPLDHRVRDPQRRNVAATGGYHETELDEPATAALLRDLPHRTGYRPDEAVLAALVDVLADACGTDRFRVDLLGHGRAESVLPGADLSRTTGWFTTVTPLAVNLPAGDPAKRLRAVADTARSMPAGAIGYGALRYLAGAPEVADLAAADVSFDYLGRVAAVYPGPLLTGTVAADLGPYVHPSWQRPHLVEVQARLRSRRLVVGWMFSTALHRPETIHGWAGEHLRRLRGLR
jgi:amino acid adenylation domain-containing protein/non-ribosomal peptide synthase protein (TIGR01720 family)